MFEAYYDKNRFRYIHDQLALSGLVSNYRNQTIIKKTGCLYSKELNVYIDTSDGVNEDLNIFEYCGRIKKVIEDAKGKRFLFFKAAHSNKWSENISRLAEENNGKVIPFFKWSFNSEFYNKVYGKRSEIVKKYKSVDKIYDIGYFCSLKPYDYPKPSEFDKLISWPDHKNFNLPGSSRMTGNYDNFSRQKIYDILSNSSFSVLFPGSVSYENYIENSFKCKVVLNPPGVGEYTSRMFDQAYLGNCIVMRKNSYDNGLSWKNYISEIDFYNKGWESKMKSIIDNHSVYADKSRSYFKNCWTPKKIVNYLKVNILREVT